MLDLPLTLTDTVLKPVRLCVITRQDGTIIRVAEAQTDLVIAGGDAAGTYSPLGGFQLSAVKHSVGAESASVQIDAAMTVGGVFDLYEVVDGFFDSATVQIFVANRESLTTAGLIFKGFVGAITFGALHNTVSFNCQGYVVKAKWPFAWTYGPMCRTELGSKLCRVPLRPPIIARNRAYVHASLENGYNYSYGRVSSNNTTDPETFGNVIFGAQNAGTTHASVQPSFNFTIGTTTVDGTVTFQCFNNWTRFAIVNEVINQFNFTLDRDPDVRAITGWYNGGGLRMYDGYSAGRTFEIGAWTASTRMITTYLPLGAANNSTLIAAGDKLEIWTGCDFTIATCATKFNNTLNFRGEPYFAGASLVAQQN